MIGGSLHMKLKGYYFILSSTIICLSGMQISEESMRDASRGLTTNEYDQLRSYLQHCISKAKENGDGEQEEALEKLFSDFYHERYALVINKLKEMGYSPQRILSTSHLRERMLTDGFGHGTVPWFIREIAGLNWFFEQDSKKIRKQWPHFKDRLAYLISLAEQLEQKHHSITDSDILQEAIETLMRRIQELTIMVPRLSHKQATEAMERLRELYILRKLPEPEKLPTADETTPK
jgi:hypothetical protein